MTSALTRSSSDSSSPDRRRYLTRSSSGTSLPASVCASIRAAFTAGLAAPPRRALETIRGIMRRFREWGGWWVALRPFSDPTNLLTDSRGSGRCSYLPSLFSGNLRRTARLHRVRRCQRRLVRPRARYGRRGGPASRQLSPQTIRSHVGRLHGRVRVVVAPRPSALPTSPLGASLGL